MAQVVSPSTFKINVIGINEPAIQTSETGWVQANAQSLEDKGKIKSSIDKMRQRQFTFDGVRHQQTYNYNSTSPQKAHNGLGVMQKTMLMKYSKNKPVFNGNYDFMVKNGPFSKASSS